VQDHKATDIAERTRIEAAGGFVVRKRVMGVLAVARSFGDFVLKKFVSAEPYTSTTKLDEEVSPLKGMGSVMDVVMHDHQPQQL
jgi:serine/threonine protein phosphatase PrpC